MTSVLHLYLNLDPSLNINRSPNLNLNQKRKLENPSLKGLSKRLTKDLRLTKPENEEPKRKRILITNNWILTQIHNQDIQNLQP